MDGGSTDGTLDILRRYGPRIAHWESARDTGVFNAWNKALDHVTGDWVCFLGADDWYAGSDVMARVAAQITEDEAAHDVYYGHMDRHLPGGRISHARERRWSRERRKRFRRGVMFPHPASFTSRAQFDVVGRFDESFTIAGDFEHLLRILKRGSRARFMDILVVNMTAGRHLAAAVEPAAHRARGLPGPLPERRRHDTGVAVARVLPDAGADLGHVPAEAGDQGDHGSLPRRR